MMDVAANGRTSSDPFVDVFDKRDPTPSDVNYPIQKKWFNYVTEAYWMLEGFSSVGGFVSAIWLKIGAGGGNTVRKVGVDADTPPGTNPVLPDVTGLITVTGGQVAAGDIDPNVIRTDSLAANAYTIEIQRSQAVADSTIGLNGVSHYDSTDFTVDGNGFVQAVGTAFIRKVHVDTSTPPGTEPVVPDAGGTITVTGGQVAAGTISPNVIRTDSLAANTYTVEIQRSQAVADSTVGLNGVSHFDSAAFGVDANGFVTLNEIPPPFVVGTFLPTVSGTTSAGTATYTQQNGNYVKLGNLIFYWFVVVWNSGTGTGSLLLSNLPFAVDATVNFGMISGSVVIDAAGIPNTTYLYLTPLSSTTTMRLDTGNAPNGTLAPFPYVASNALFEGSGFYVTP